MTLVLHRALRSDAPEPDVRIRYLRYKPGTNLVVHYDVGLDDEWHEAVAMIASGSYLRRRALKPENRALARLVDGRSPAPDPLVYDAETDALVQWLPLDLALPALAEPPESLQRRIESAGAALDGSDSEPARLAYKPRRRVVLRFGSSVVKHYADEDEFEAAVVGLRESARTRALSTPSFDASLPDLLLTVQPLLAGTRPEDPADAAGEAGEFLAALHALPPTRLRATSPADQLRAAANSAGLVAVLRSELAPRLEGLLARLEETLPTEAPLVSTHGDFNARQLLLHRGELSVVDFDAMSAAPGAVDLATYAAYVVLGGDGDLDRARMVLHALLDGYGEPPEALSWYLSTCILRRSPRPFRYLDEHWPVRVESMVAASEAALAG